MGMSSPCGRISSWPEGTLPLELKRELFAVLSDQVRKQIKQRGLSEEEVVADFETWRKKKRETRSRR